MVLFIEQSRLLSQVKRKDGNGPDLDRFIPDWNFLLKPGSDLDSLGPKNLNPKPNP